MPSPLTQTLESPSNKIPLQNVLIGYCRTSTSHSQDLERQIRQLKEVGCTQIFTDQISSLTDYKDREGLSKCLEELEEGNVLVISELSRLGRSLVEMIVQVNNLLERNIGVKTLDGRLDTTSMPPEIVKLVVAVIGYAAEIELQTLKSRCESGRAVARSRGVKFGRKRSYTPQQAATILEMRKQGHGYGTIGKSLGMNATKVRNIILRAA